MIIDKGNYKLYKGDCLEVMDGLINLGVKVDSIICDPPYGTTKCKWDSVIPFDKMWCRLNKLIKPNGTTILFGTEPFTSSLIQSNVKNFREKLTWKKHKPSNFACGKFMHLKYTEDIIVFANKKPTYNPQMIKREGSGTSRILGAKSKKWNTVRNDGNEVSMQTQYEPKDYKEYNKDFKYPSNILEFPSVVGNSKEKVDHPTQKPVLLLENLIETYTNENELILDFTAGSFSTGVACINTSRRFIGIELDEKYFEIGRKRMENIG